MPIKKYTTAQERSANWYGANWIRKEKRLAIYIRDNFACVYCGAQLKGCKPGEISLDHIVPVNAGGSNEATNLVTCCRACNNRKQDTPICEWLNHNAGAILVVFLQADQPLNIALAKSLIEGKEGGN